MKIKSPISALGHGLAISLAALSLSTPALAGWEVQWIDQFDGDSVNWDNWTAQTNANYNAEIQCYTDDDHSPLRNYDVSDGTLKIIARRMDINCPGLNQQHRSWTSGRLNSKDKQEFLYGRIETRIRFHNLEQGTWPAFWMLENRIHEQPIKGDDDFVHWPNEGASEIDVWEWYARNPGSYITNFFNTVGCGSEYRYSYPNGASDVLDWHRYAIEWSEDLIEFYVDDTLVVSHDMSNCQRYQEPMFALLNVAMGGTLGGAVDPALQTATMEVDYIAHCLPSEESEHQYCDQDAAYVPPAFELPEFTLSLSQAGEMTQVIDSQGGEVLVLADMEIPDDASLSLNWDLADIPSPIFDGYSVRFDPYSMPDGRYSLSLTLSNDLDSSQAETLELSFDVEGTVEEPGEGEGEEETGDRSQSAGSSFGLYLLFLLIFALFWRGCTLPGARGQPELK